jgi:hypothetical protein
MRKMRVRPKNWRPAKKFARGILSPETIAHNSVRRSISKKSKNGFFKALLGNRDKPATD